MLIKERSFSGTEYRYGYQGQEKDDEVKGEGNSMNYTFRMHDPRLGRFFAVDPLTVIYPHNSPYTFSENRVIDGIELEGLEVENIWSGFHDVSKLKPQLPNVNNGEIQRQIYKVTVEKNKLSFEDLREILLTKPQTILDSKGADFHPNFPTGTMKEGDNIKIEIDGPFNNSIVRVFNVLDSDDKIQVTFVTLEGHVERGVIQFTIEKLNESNFQFTINGVSEMNNGMAIGIDSIGDFTRVKQVESWLEVLNNFVEANGEKNGVLEVNITSQTATGEKGEIKEKTVQFTGRTGSTGNDKAAEKINTTLNVKKNNNTD